jgi:hypothetical protein
MSINKLRVSILNDRHQAVTNRIIKVLEKVYNTTLETSKLHH